MMERLYGDYDYTFQDLERTKGMDFVQKYLRMKHVIVFKMSHDVLQVRLLSAPMPTGFSLLIIRLSPPTVQLLRPHEDDHIVARTINHAYRQEL